MHILVIEDEPQLARHLCSALTRSGHEARAVADGPGGLQAALQESPDLVVLDLNLPGMNGLAVLEEMRKARCTSRVIILTALGDVDHRIKGLKAGADDYLAKPFSMEELVARVEALGRRAPTPVQENQLHVADLHMDVHQRRVLCERVWQREHEYDTRTVEIFIARLRKKIDAGAEEPLIHTVRAMGYTVKAMTRETQMTA